MRTCLPALCTAYLCLSFQQYVAGQSKPNKKDPAEVLEPLGNARRSQPLIDDTKATGLLPKRAGESVALFNGKNLEGWTHVLADKNVQMDEVWKVRDGGILWCRGKPTGYLRTKRDDFENYELMLEWRWPAGTKGGNNGVLVHTTDPGALGIWPRSFEAQLFIGNAGDIWVIGTTMEIPNPEGRIKERRHINLTDGSEKPIGEWNKFRVICDGDKLTIFVNGDKVNYAHNLSQTKGAICLQSEGAEIEYRNIELRPLAKK